MPTSRRRFLTGLAAAGAGFTLVPGCITEALAPEATPAVPVRAHGHVRSPEGGVPGVAVTDGLTVTTTDDRGAFTLLSSSDRPFIYLCVPDGYVIPQSRTGTARFYAPMAPNARSEMEAIFYIERDRRSYKTHHFIALADPQTQNRRDVQLFRSTTVPDVRATVRALGEGPVFGITCGDLMYDDLNLLPEYERAVEEMGLPFFQVVGNHDLDFGGRSDEATATTFRRYFGPTYYSFDRGGVHYVVLDDVFWHGTGYVGYLDEPQLAWLTHDLAPIEPGRTVVVFTHIPALSTQDLRHGWASPDSARTIHNRERLYRLLEPYTAHIVSGHTHEHEHVFEHGTHEHVLGTVCGAWWSGPICADGTPNGYAVFSVHGDELRWRYKATGHDPAYQLTVYPPGADPSIPDAVVANVWDWHPGWQVVWYEDGMRRGAMTRRTGTDPLAERLHRGPDHPRRAEWVEPIRTDHRFVATPHAGGSYIRVEATDPWGRTYSATL